jgi:hypothetical protein
MNSEYTVLNDHSNDSEKSHREIAEMLIKQLREEMPEDEFRVQFHSDLQGAVIDAITRDLSSNLAYEDWYGAGFQEPEDFLVAEDVSEQIAQKAEHAFKNDQIGKSWDILVVILEYAEEYGLVERDVPDNDV